MARRPLLLLCSLLALAAGAGCDDPVADDAGVLADAGALADAEVFADASEPVDAAPDASAPDATADAGASDASPDAGPEDAGAPDSGTAECGDGLVEDEEVCDPGVDGCCNMDCTGPRAADVQCRAAAGPCDVAEVCDGLSTACPADALAPAQAECRAAAGPCDVAEACDGVDPACPADLVASSTVTCRGAAGACDVAETCDGVGAACPSDVVLASTVTCRPAVDVCDAPEVCDGVSPMCPADLVASSTVACRGAAGACDAVELCDGVNVSCPPDQLASMGTICRPMAGDCDVPETCDGATLDCPADNLAPDATPCLSCPGVTASCGGCYSGICVDAQELCADILANGMSVGDGVYTIAPDPVGTSTAGVRTVPAYCDMTTGGGGWTLIYKKSPLLPGNPGAMFTGTPTRAQDLSVLGRFPSDDYVSDFHVAAWSAFTEVRVEILTGTVATKFIEFDAIGSTPTDWFSAGRHTTSSWTDLPTDPNWDGSAQGRFFSIDPGGSRKFYVNRTWGGCPADRGWLMISFTDFCPWERRTTQPNEILYSVGPTEALWNDVNQVGYGDAFLIWAR